MRRLLTAALLLAVVVTLTFFAIHLLPGDPVLLILTGGGSGGAGGQITDELIQAVRTKLGLDRSLPVQFLRYAGGILRADLGESLFMGFSVTELLGRHFPRTLELVIVGSVWAVVVGVILGITAATARSRLVDGLISTVAAFGISVPGYVTAVVLLLLFALELKWLPASGYRPFFEDPGTHIRVLILPAIAVGLRFSTMVARMTRSSILEAYSLDFIRTARAKGLAERTVVYRHVLRNALIPVVTIVGLQFGQLIGGTVIVEYVFNWPGLSTLLFQALYRRDYPVIQGVLLMVAVTFITINIVVDALYAVIDPRIRYS